MPLTRDQILSANDRPVKEIDVPEWGGAVLIRPLGGDERDEYETSMISMSGSSLEVRMKNARARLVSIGCVDEQGNRLFSAKDVELLAKKSAAALDRVYTEIRAVSGLSDGDMEMLTSNFTLALTGGSSSS